tara:strand:+ start:211 stop:546 length:336 start_codon:yes stop_codon:yes gene_type:complete
MPTMKFAVVTYRSEAAMLRNSTETVEYFDNFDAAWDRETDLVLHAAAENPSFGFFMGHEVEGSWDAVEDKVRRKADQGILDRAQALHAVIPAEEVGNPNFCVMEYDPSNNF